MSNFRSVTGVRASVVLDDPGELHIYSVRRGVWTLRQGAKSVVVGAGQFLAVSAARTSGYETAPDTTAAAVRLPLDSVGGSGRPVTLTGSAGTRELRLLMAHAQLLHETVEGLTAIGANAARNALVELARGILHSDTDPAETALQPALARAAREFVDQGLIDPELSPALLARELHVSVRTLSRAFASTGESAAAYIRRRRLEAARQALTAGLSVTEAAARWQFADSSHFIRNFRRSFGETPAQFARRCNRPPDA